MSVTPNTTWFHLNHDMVSRRIQKLSFYGENSITLVTFRTGMIILELWLLLLYLSFERSEFLIPTCGPPAIALYYSKNKVRVFVRFNLNLY